MPKKSDILASLEFFDRHGGHKAAFILCPDYSGFFYGGLNPLHPFAAG